MCLSTALGGYCVSVLQSYNASLSYVNLHLVYEVCNLLRIFFKLCLTENYKTHYLKDIFKFLICINREHITHFKLFAHRLPLYFLSATTRFLDSELFILVVY
jgi:hypothetical protein